MALKCIGNDNENEFAEDNDRQTKTPEIVRER